MSKFANGTSVPVDRTRAEIERVLSRYGAEKFASGWDQSAAVLVFEAHARRVKFVLPLPAKDEKRYRYTPTGKWRYPGKRADALALRAWEADCRQRWRALLLVIKAKLEAVESGITSFESEFLAHIVLPTGETVGDWAGPQLHAAYERGMRMPPLLGSGG